MSLHTLRLMADIRLACSVIVLVCTIIVHMLTRCARRVIFPPLGPVLPVAARSWRIGFWLSVFGMGAATIGLTFSILVTRIYY